MKNSGKSKYRRSAKREAQNGAKNCRVTVTIIFKDNRYARANRDIAFRKNRMAFENTIVAARVTGIRYPRRLFPDMKGTR